MSENSAELLKSIPRELERAYRARAAGNQGLARVCARRAAGWAIKVSLNAKGIFLDTPSAIEHIRYLGADPATPPNILKVLEYLQQRVVKETAHEDSYWPRPEIDLVQEAHWLVEELLEFRIDLVK
ncbi:MAG: hypothetical protein HYZ26_10785 [Chloroflexi bacterium]|nr:hypothetical protein [Chloroflexota bacterium]